MSVIEKVKSDILPNPAKKTVLCFLSAWAVLLVAGIFVQGFHAVDLAWGLGLAFRLLLVGGAALSVSRYLLSPDPLKPYRGFKAFLGYGVILTYVAGGVSLASWYENSLIGKGVFLALWIYVALTCLPITVLYFMVASDKWRVKLGVMTEQEVREKEKFRCPKPVTVVGKILDNVDAVVQAVILVSIIHTTLFQLYVIPSESMVPKFLIGDRVIVTKFQSGPRLPLSPIKLPVLSAPKRGDIVVFDNPFSEKPPVLKRMLNTVVFYITFSFVQLDRDELGNIRTSTVVKRLVGVPGDKLLMLDDVLYRKAPGSADWVPLAEDAKFSHVDLYKEKPETLRKIQTVVINEDDRKQLKAIDDWKSTVTLTDLCASLAVKRDALLQKSRQTLSRLPARSAAYLDEVKRSGFGNLATEGADQDIAKTIATHAMKIQGDVRVCLQGDVSLCLYVLSQAGGQAALKDFLTVSESEGGLNPYDLAAAKLNLRLKINQADRWSAYLDYLSQDDTRSLSSIDAFDFQGDAAFGPIFRSSQVIKDWVANYRYLQMFEYRNFPEFPAGKDEYIPAHHYFLIGDNRYNSLDFRFNHYYKYTARNLDSQDPRSVIYKTDLEMNTLSDQDILGKVSITFWPPGAGNR
jgi:signal peptidase I